MAVTSYPDIHVTGAIHHYTRRRGGGGIYYLGTCEITPQMQRQRFVQRTLNDWWGKTLPAQKTYDGEMATISTLLTRFSKTAYWNTVNAGAAALVTDGTTYGNETRLSRGHGVFGRSDFELWQVYDFALFPTVASANLEIGWYWPQCTLENHDTVAAGTQGEKLLLVIEATPVRLASTDANPYGFVLHSADPTLFPADVLVPQ